MTVKVLNKVISTLNELKDSLDVNNCSDMAINIIIDSSDIQQQIFVEIENDKGESISIGEEIESPEGFRQIRITTADIISHIRI